MVVSGNLGRKIPVVDDVFSYHEQEICPTTSLDENCIKFEIQMDRNYYVDFRQTYLALKLNFVKSPGYRTYSRKDIEKEHKEEAKVDEEPTKEEKQEAPVPLATHSINISHSLFSNAEVYINNQQISNSNGLYEHKCYISNKFMGAIFEHE